MRRRSRGEMRTPGDVRDAINKANREIRQREREERKRLTEAEVRDHGRPHTSNVLSVSPQRAPHSGMN